MRVRRAPRLAILGPPGCGKSQVLTRLRNALTANGQPEETVALTIDLQEVPIGSLNHMYQVINRTLLREARGNGMPVDFDVADQHHHLRFPQILRGLMESAEGCLILFIDHLDSVPRYFARDLSQRLRDLLEKSDKKYDCRRLGVVVAGTISLIELRREVNSPLLMFDLTLLPTTNPAVRWQMVEEWLREFDVQDVPPEIIDILAHETGGEASFLDLLITPLLNRGGEKKLALNHTTIRAAVDAIIARSDSDVMRHLAFHLWGDKDLRDLIRELKRGEVVRRRAVTSDTDRFHLHGAVIAGRAHPSAYESYSFRNGIVERFLKRLLELLEEGGADPPGMAVLKDVRALEEIKARCTDAKNLRTLVEEMQSAWRILTPYGDGQPQINFYATGQDSNTGWLLDVDADSVTRVELREEPAEAVTRAAFYAASSSALAVGSTAEGFNVSFGHDDKNISLGIPLMWRRTRVVLLTTLRRVLAGNEYTEFTLNHWIRFVHEVKRAVAVLALAKLGQHVVLAESQKRGAPGPEPQAAADPESGGDSGSVKQVFWIPNYGAILSEQGAVSTLMGAMRPRAVEDINARCLELVTHTTDAREYQDRLARISEQFVDGLKAIPNLCEQMTSNATSEQLVITTDIEGLKLPFEILPHRRSYLALLKPIARQLGEIQLGPGPRRSFRRLVSSLVKGKGTLRVLLVASEAGGELSKAGEELAAVRKSVQAGCDRLGLRVDFNELAGPKAIVGEVARELLERRPYHLFHFVGHASHSLQDPTESGLVLAGAQGLPETVSCQALRHWVEGSDLSFAYLSSCYGSAVSGSAGTFAQPYTGVIEALVTGGVPNVLGFRWAVTDAGALNFASEFYRHLFETQGAEKNLLLAVHHARRSTETRSDSFDAWASSILVTQVW